MAPARGDSRLSIAAVVPMAGQGLGSPAMAHVGMAAFWCPRPATVEDVAAAVEGTLGDLDCATVPQIWLGHSNRPDGPWPLRPPAPLKSRRPRNGRTAF